VGLTAELEPVLAESSDAGTVQAAERATMQQGMLAFQREWGRYRSELRGRVPSLAGGARELLLAMVARALVAPTESEARMLARWLHDENFGSQGVESLVSPEAARAAPYFDAKTLIDVPMSELYWPFGFAKVYEERLAESAEAVAMGLVSAEALSSVVETGDVELLADHGLGFWEGSRVSVTPRRNRFGLTLVRRRLEGNGITRVRIDIAKAPALVRLDWAAFSCEPRGGGEPVVVRFETAEELERLSPRRFTEIARNLYLVGPGSQLTLDLAGVGSEPALAVGVELAYAAMPVAPPRGQERLFAARWRAKTGLRAGKRMVLRLQDRTGLPVAGPLKRAWSKRGLPRL
jgi:hypothetical protein